MLNNRMKTVSALAIVLCAILPSVVQAEDVPAKPAPAAAGLRLPAIFSDHMVLQRDLPVPVWGWTEAGEEITVTIGVQTVGGKAGADGKWLVLLKPMKAIDTTEMVI